MPGLELRASLLSRAVHRSTRLALAAREVLGAARLGGARAQEKGQLPQDVFFLSLQELEGPEHRSARRTVRLAII